MHRRDDVRPCRQPQRVAFNGAFSCKSVCEIQSHGNQPQWDPLRRLSLFIRISHMKQMSLTFHEWVAFSAAMINTLKWRRGETERGKTGEWCEPTPGSSVIKPPAVWQLAWKEQKSGGYGLDGVAGGEDNYETGVHTRLTFYKADGCVAAELFSSRFFISPSINLRQSPILVKQVSALVPESSILPHFSQFITTFHTFFSFSLSQPLSAGTVRRVKAPQL